MTTPVPECPACRRQMEPGFVLELGDHNSQTPTRWFAGRLERGLLGRVKVKDRRRLDTVTFRCPGCGWLIWFAPDAPPPGDE